LRDWIHEFTPAEVEEMDAALRLAKALPVVASATVVAISKVKKYALFTHFFNRYSIKSTHSSAEYHLLAIVLIAFAS